MIRQIYLFSIGGVGWVFRKKIDRIEDNRDENDVLYTGFFAAIKGFSTSDGMPLNNVEYISWIYGYTVFSSCEGKFTVVITSDKKENVERLFECAEQIRENIIDQLSDQVHDPDYFSDGQNMRIDILPIITNVLKERNYFTEEDDVTIERGRTP